MGSENEETMELQAEHLFLLMKKDYRISRNARAEWYFNHLNHTVQIPKADKVENLKGEIEIVSAIPQETPIEWDWDTSHLYQYVISPSTVVTFLSHTYRLALCLDLSPSAATVDCVGGFTLLDEILTSFKNCVQGLARPFTVPGSQLLFCPKIYVTVIAHTPFLVSKGQQVLVAGWLLQQDNVNAFVDLVQFKLSSIEVRLSCWTNFVEEQRDAQLADVERLVGGLFESLSDKTTNSTCSTISMATPEISFISILRYGMLALELLPEKSSAGIIIFTDGVFGTTDAGWSEALLSQLRHNTIACSFVQAGSRTCHPASSEGFLPNNDLMEFVASTTFGTCLSSAPHVDNDFDYQMNVYHKHFLTWGFEKYLLRPAQTDTKSWSLSNRCFEASAIHRVKKKVSEYQVNCSLHSVLSCRLREGFTIKEVHLDDDVVEVHLALPWRPAIEVEYLIRGQWPITQGTVRCAISVQGPYDFLHDVTCRKIQSLCSRYRQLVVQSYWALVKNLSETDQLLVHLHSFSSNPAFYTVPEAVKNGVPLFYLPPNESSLVNASSDFAYPQFDAFWRPICVLDIGYWQRWLHCHRIGILFQHDRPLPKHLHLPSTSGRYHSIQCRQAATALNAALRDFTSFVLLENHSYIGLVCTDSEKPVSFYLVRLTHKPPCVLIRIAFLGGTTGSIRQKVVADLKKVIQSLNFPQRSLPQDSFKSVAAIPCCKVLQKPAEKILLRYEKMPVDFFQIVPNDPFVGQNNNNQKRSSSSPGTQWSTLSHYLHHRRWIWCIQGSPGLSLSLNSVARILSIITKMRLQEGFSFAHSSSGIFTFLLELDMEGRNCQLLPTTVDDESSDHPKNCACVVQYVLFPPHSTGSFGLKDSEDEATEESDILDSSDAQLEIVTECWVEPQIGVVGDSPHERRFFQGLDYPALAESFHPMDLDCISSLVTFEHLNLMCRQADRAGPATGDPEKSIPPSPGIQRRRDEFSPSTANGSFHDHFTPPNGWDRRTEEALKDDTITCVPFCFQLPRLLPKCSRAKLMFSTFVQEFKSPVRYSPSAADSVNELLFNLLTRQLSQLGLQEVILQESDCRELLKNLDLQAAADSPLKDNDFQNSKDPDTEVDSFATPRETCNTPRSPRDINLSNPPSRPSLLTPLNISYRSGINVNEEKAESAANNNKVQVPMWRCFVKSVSSSHILLVLLPASFQDLKLLMLNDEHLQMSHSPHLAKVKPDFTPQMEPYTNNEGSMESKSTNEEVAKHLTTDDDQMTSCSHSQSTSQPCSLGPTRTNSFAGQQRPRLASHSAVQTARIRAGSLDTAPLPHDQHNPPHPHQFQHQHVHASCSVGSADRRQSSKASNSLFGSGASYFRPVTSLPSFSSPVRSAPVFASLTLNVYVFDCPLTNLVSQLLSRGTNPKVTLCRDHTFPNEEDISTSNSEDKDEDKEEVGQPPSEPVPDDPVSAGSINILSQYCAVVEALYCKCLGQALFTSLQQGQAIHSRDVEAAMNLCKETLLEVDITAFIQNICGHVKDFKMKAGVEVLRNRRQSSSSGEPLADEDAKWLFPLSLLRLHQPCANLKHLHKLIRTRFQEILCLSFKPVPSLFDYYFYCPPDHPISPAPTDMAAHNLSVGLDDNEVVEFRRSFDNDNSVSQTCSLTGGRSDSGSEPIDDVEWEEEGESEVPPVPLFLHLTATVRSKKNVASQSLNALPTCLGDLMSILSGSSAVLDLKGLKITLDFLCLTFRSDPEELVPGHHNQRTTSFCSSSSGILDPNNPSTLASQSELSEDEDAIPMDEDDRTESISRQLLHIPEGQRRPIKAALGEIEWMLRDEIVAFMLDSFPLPESTLTAVVQHVQSSSHRPSYRRRIVPLHFVLNQQESSRRFLAEFKKMPIQGHRLREEGSFFYLTESTSLTKFQGSLDPPLGSSSYSKTNADLTSDASASRSLIAQTSTDSCATGGLVVEEQSEEGGYNQTDYQLAENTIGELEIEAGKEGTVMIDSTITLVSNSEGDATADADCTDVRLEDVNMQSDSPLKKSSKRRFESGTTSIPGTRHSDSSSLVDSIRNTEDGYEGGSSDSEDECEWLKDLDMEKPKMPPFWLVLKVNEDAVVTYFHCRYELARPEELLQWRQIHEDLLNSITALGKLINQQMLLKDLHDTKLCNGLLEPETNDDIWHQDDLSHIKTSSYRNNSEHFHYGYQEQPSYLEATLKLQPGTFQCRQVWETHFPLHPRLKTGPGKLGTSKGVQQLRIVLSGFSVNNRNNMFVYQEDSGNVFYLRLNESSCISHRNPSDSISVSRYNTDEADGVAYSCSRRSSNWNVSGGLDEDSVDLQRRSGSFSERDSVGGGDQTSLGSISLNRSQQYQSQQHLMRREDCIQLKVHGITEAGQAIKGDLVRVLQNKLDDAVLEVLHSLLSRNSACKLTSDDVHFIQKPHEAPHIILQSTVQACAFPYLPALAYYLRQNLLGSVVYMPKYMDNYVGHHFQDYSALSPAPTSDVYLYNRPQGSGNRGIACIAFSLVDGQGNPVSNLEWPRPITFVKMDGGVGPSSLNDFDEFISTNLFEKVPERKGPGPMAVMEFRIWERGHINLDVLKEKLESAIQHALWDVVLEYRLLPFPLCAMTDQDGMVVPQSMADGLPCSEPTTPVRRKWQLIQPIVPEEDVLAVDPRSRSVSFSGLPPNRPGIVSTTSHPLTGNSTTETKWRMRHTSGTSNANRERPLSPVSSLQFRSSGPTSPIERFCERSMSTSSVTSSLTAGTLPIELDKFELGEQGLLHPVYFKLLESWFNLGLQKNVASVQVLKTNILAPLSVPTLLKAVIQIFSSSMTPELSMNIFASPSPGAPYAPCLPIPKCPKQGSVDRSTLDKTYILIGRNMAQWKESLSGEINLPDIQQENNGQVALKVQQSHQRFVSYIHFSQSNPCPKGVKLVQSQSGNFGSVNDVDKMNTSGEHGSLVSLLIPRQRLLWATVNSDQEWVMWMYNFNKDSYESLLNQCTKLVQWHNARWALLSSIVSQKLGLFHNQQCSGRVHAHQTLRNNPFLILSDMEALAKLHVPPVSRDYNANRKPNQSSLPHLAHLETFRDSKPTRLLSNTPYGNQGDLVTRHGTQWIDKRYSERREEMQRLLVLCPARSSGNNISITGDVIQLFKQVARIIHYCFTPLLFLPKWRLQVARTRDPNMSMATLSSTGEFVKYRPRHESGNSINSGRNSPSNSPPRQPRRPTDDHWHQSLCSAYLQEYVQYLHTLGFLQMEIKPFATKRGPKSALKTQRLAGEETGRVRHVSHPSRMNGGPSPTSQPTSSDSNTLYFHKSHQGGILVCEVAIQEPFFYTKVYALEMSRLLHVGMGGVFPNVAHIASAQAHYTDRFLNECDHIKVLLHLHSFTYDFHLRTLNSFVSGRHYLLKPGFHLVSFLDDFTKYYNKAPNFARNQVVSNSLTLKDPATPGEQLFNYLLSHERRYGFHVLRMASSTNSDSDEATTEYVLAKQWPFKTIQREYGDLKHADDYDVTLLVSHESVNKDPMTIFIKFYVIMTSKREYYPRLLMEKKPGKFCTVSTATPVKAASAPPLEIIDRVTEDSASAADSTQVVQQKPASVDEHKISKSNMDLQLGDKERKTPSPELLSISNPEVSFVQRNENAIVDAPVPEENRTSPAGAAAVAAAAAAAAAAVKHTDMRSPMFIRQEVINYLGYYTKHEQDMQSMMSEQARKAEELIRAIVNQAKVHCRRDTLWQRLQQNPAAPSNNLTYLEFRELLTLSHAEPISSNEPQLVPLLNQPVSWYQGLAKLLLSRYPENHRFYSSADGKIQYVIVLHPKLPGTAMMLSCDVLADKAELNSLCQEMPSTEIDPSTAFPDNGFNSRPLAMQGFIEDFVNLCAFHMWRGLLG